MKTPPALALALLLSPSAARVRGARPEDDARGRRLRLNIFAGAAPARGGDAAAVDRATRIIGGSPAARTRYPYSVSLQDRLGHYCGGSLIAPNIVLTAAHCGEEVERGHVVLVNCPELNNDMKGCSSSSGQRIEIAKEILHPDWNQDKTDNDFSVLVLLDAVDMTGVRLVTLNADTNYPREDQDVTVTGFGDTERSNSAMELSPELLEVRLDVISNRDCDRAKGNSWVHAYENQITKNMLCTKTKNKDACQGDSGGPLVVKGDVDVQVGVVSWGIGCAYMPGVFARVSEAYEWIETMVCEHGVEREVTAFRCPGRGAPPGAAAEPAPTPPAPTWRTVFEEDFDGTLGVFEDGGGNAKRQRRKKGRAGVVKLQRGAVDAEAASVSVEDVDVEAYSECRVAVSFYLQGMENDDAWHVEYAADDADDYQVAQAFGMRWYRNRIWYDDNREATFSVDDVRRVKLRLRGKGSSPRDVVFIDDVRLECK